MGGELKLLLRRDQRSAVIGLKPVFQLDVRAEITEDERNAINKYKLGKTMLYERSTIVDPGAGLLGLASRMVHHALNLTISVDDLANGKRIECKDVVEMVAIEEHLQEAGKLFAQVMRACMNFGGEEVVEL